jgi:hypothetical protein
LDVRIKICIAYSIACILCTASALSAVYDLDPAAVMCICNISNDMGKSAVKHFQLVRTMSDHPFEYDRLDTTKEQIRLIRLSSDDPQSVPSFTITQFDARTAPPYKALSYTWGSRAKTWSIKINRASFQVYHNLHSFLCLLQDKQIADYYWIDQLCIDQSNVLERNHQVSLMQAIYQRAEEVIIWLDNLPSSGRFPDFLASLDGTALQKKADVKDKSLEAHSEGFEDFVNDTYWTRLWIVQEILLARKLSFASPSSWCPWEKLENAHFVVDIHWRRCTVAWFLNQRSAKNKREWGYEDYEDHEPPRGYYPLAQLIFACSGSQCQDARDKIYGLQGLVMPTQRLEIDYSKTMEEVCLDAMEVVLQTGPEAWRVEECMRVLKTLSPDAYDALLTRPRSSAEFEYVNKVTGRVPPHAVLKKDWDELPEVLLKLL